MGVRAGLAVVCLGVVLAGCGGRDEADAPSLREVSLPDLARVDATVQEQVRDRHAALERTLANPEATAAERASAYGQLGMLLQAGEYHDAAEPAYLNAQTLDPSEPKWPYYLATLHKSRGETDRAMAAYRRVIELRPDYVPALVWLGRMHLDQGQADQAEPLFQRAQAIEPENVAALTGLGQAALARRDFARAAERLEEALAIDPSASSAHSPLAMAYRGLGDTARAEAHLEEWRNTEILLIDPLRQELDLALDSGLSYELRGVRALEARDFEAAANFFREGARLSPGTTSLGRSLRHKLGTALYLKGDLPGAIEQFNEVVRFAPADGLDETAAKARYSLGILMASAGRQDAAIEHLTAAVSQSPNYVEALQALGDALRRRGRDAAALPRYQAVLTIDPRSVEARFGYAMALVRLKRYGEARDWLAEAMRLHPDRPEFTLVMARLLAAAPDDTVRDGTRAMALVDELLTGDRTVELGETTAMGLAELGRYDEAAGVQRQVIAAAKQAGLQVDLDRLQANLRLYERGQPSRTPWADDDPIHAPGPPVVPELRAMLANTR